MTASASATLHAANITAGHANAILFSGLNLTVASGDVIGLVGPNGAGKSTLLRILTGEKHPEAGTVTRTLRHAQLGYLTQEPDAHPGETIRQALTRRTGVAAATAHMNAAAEALGNPDADATTSDAYSNALETWLNLGGADLDERMPSVAEDLGLDVDLDREVESLSGGQAARVGLACLLLSRYDAYLLDEPTNDLDVAGLSHLENFVTQLNAPVVLVSHDREFLARVATGIVEIDRSLQKITTYGGGYDAYLEERSIRRRHAREAYEDYAKRKADLEARARMQRAWMDKGVKNAVRKAKASHGKEKDKNIRHHNRGSSEKQAAKIKITDKLLERLETVEEPRKEWQLQFSIAAAPRSGDIVAQAKQAIARRGDFTFGPLTIELHYGDRVAVTGPNGAGKSTLLNVLLGRIQPIEGTVSAGSRVVIGEIDQARAAFEGEETLGRRFSLEVPDWPDADVRTLLAKFGLKTNHVNRSAFSLSPGERTRAGLALLQARGVNLLVLDEPTNHLDLPAIEQLEEALEAFDGTILLVTHDRRMLESVRLTRRWHVENGTIEEIDAD
ncbi:ABC-F family ATP-binding cassette domain-containing protein [Dermatophilus congolensis]|uniref:ABC-F family ATP-binding cassette domain-containing protein n=1 Tax=Dermatophilus congolensis TaxID=1863 RepID=UPI001AAE640D|nr:ABC-F family ATP-binding cassette domain-containing protein [Dermatophilus congolensis]MBO3155875.1 ABC-F family ATP-binding cassette domain-containing protein [Dermatophilus congolensis]MBO3159301.1 ABC-F family ATP-binding cassette domain-containing protein [Dermatophilus congolensis]MBO3164914.1 ABC-F family ATP-binding cassette domain-containing protein [Dermatophilus congolensis]MBO3170572.1 ABC-F family ATP-binding cassette domain-containing protein [Dermatophilus congolensis]MBO31750